MPNTYSTIKLESWKPVVGYEGWYEVSDRGNVKRVRRGKGSRSLGRNLLPQIDNTGYPKVFLCKHNIETQFHVHRLVMAAFGGQCPERHDVHHKNCIRSDNRFPENLEYLPIEVHHSKKGIQNPNSKLTENQVLQIKLLKPNKKSDLAKRFGVTPSAISLIRRGKNWKHISIPTN